MAITTAHDHSAAAPRSVRNIDAVATTQTPVASPYYNDARDVVPTVYTFVDTA
jgi:hypothetical protein